MSSRETRRSEGQASTPARSPRGQLFGRLLNSFASRIGQAGASADAHRVIAQCRALLSERGEVSGARLAADVLKAYQALDPREVDVFFALLATEFAPDGTAIRLAADAFSTDQSARNLLRLQTAVEPPRQELFRRLNTGAGGTAVPSRCAGNSSTVSVTTRNGHRSIPT